MDLNNAIQTAESVGAHIRDDATMRTGWTLRWVAEKKLFFYFDPKGEQAYRVQFSDAQRASSQWRTTVLADYPQTEERK